MLKTSAQSTEILYNLTSSMLGFGTRPSGDMLCKNIIPQRHTPAEFFVFT